MNYAKNTIYCTKNYFMNKRKEIHGEGLRKSDPLFTLARWGMLVNPIFATPTTNHLKR